MTPARLFFRVDTLIPLSVGAVILFASVQGSAQMTSFTDVPSGAYYEEAAAHLLQVGALDQEARLRPSELATRAELVKLFVNLKNAPLSYPRVSSFNDVSIGTWYSPYFEASASAGWVHGDGNCYGNRPCFARPASRVNRAEAATLFVRVFGLERTNTAPRFPDNPSSAWYYDNLQISADNCVLQGDDVSGYVRPSASMNRAEMVVMFYRAMQNLQYGTDCGMLASHITVASAQSTNRVRLTFSEDVRSSVATVRSHYTVRRVSDNKLMAVDSAVLVSNRVVDLTLGSEMDSATNYSVTVDGLVTIDGTMFSDSARFTSLEQSATILQVLSPSSRRLILQFDADLDTARAELATRYSVMRVAGSTNVAVVSADLTSRRTVELLLASDLMANTSYQVTASALLTTGGTSFTSSDTFSFQPETGVLTDVTVLSSTRVRLHFSTALDATRALSQSAYSIVDGTHSLSIQSVHLIDQTTVEITLSEVLLSQRSYVVNVLNMLTTHGTSFSDTRAFTSGVSGSVFFSAILTGGQEVPSVTTNATGTGSFTLTENGLQYDISLRTLSGSQIIGAHFHSGQAGSTGPVLHTITFIGTRSMGTWNLSVSDRNLLLDGKVYVNVHTNQYPNGEIRAQLHQ